MRRRALAATVVSACCAGSVGLAIVVFAPAASTPAAGPAEDPPPAAATSVIEHPPSTVLSGPAVEEQAEATTAVVDAVRAVVPGAEVGLVVYDRLTDSMIARVNSDQTFYAASLVKLLITVDLLYDQNWPVDEPVRQTLAELLGASNDGIGDRLWWSGGGRSVVIDSTALLGLQHTAPPIRAEEWEMTRISADDVITLYRYVVGLPQPARELVLSSLTGPGDHAADGFDQFFGIPRGIPDAPWNVKQGWMLTASRVVLHTTGVVGEDSRYLIALLTHQPLAADFRGAANAVSAGIAALAPMLTLTAESPPCPRAAPCPQLQR